jgi:chromosome partitioning protein
MSYIISITNQKGGVGKTTTSVNLAACLAKQNYKVLLIDLDPQGHASEHLGIAKNDHEKTILEVLDKSLNLSEVATSTYIPNLIITPANLRLGKFNQNNPLGNQFVLKESLTQEALDYFDFILIDCQPSLSLLTLNALTASDSVLLPVQAEFFALDGLTQLIVTLKDVQLRLHPKLHVLGILVTMFDNRNRLSGEVWQELNKNFDKEVFKTVIPRNVKLAEAPSFGKSIFDYDPASTGAKAYHNICVELISKVKLNKNNQ